MPVDRFSDILGYLLLFSLVEDGFSLGTLKLCLDWLLRFRFIAKRTGHRLLNIL